MSADKTITCRDCGVQFDFTVREQEFFAERGFGDPVRCIACRRALKAKRQGEGDAQGGGRPAGAPGGENRAPRPDDRPRTDDRPRREGGYNGGGQGYNGGGQRYNNGGGGYNGGRGYQGGGGYNGGGRDYRGPQSAQAQSQQRPQSDEELFPELRPNYRAEPVLAGGYSEPSNRRERPRAFTQDFPTRREREKRSARPRQEDSGGGHDED